ncbi:hypothetical protein ENBRE01_0231 [Enteropsectra breve]|nr:hypothetical protein ENBRE01_0231 [Enteropsectra breve]
MQDEDFLEQGRINKIPKFLKRLYHEVGSPDNPYICWSDDGETIKIANKELFVKHTLQSLSKTKEYSTFIRQLNIYGFIKIKNEKNEDMEEYSNMFFKRNSPHLLEFIKRERKGARNELGSLAVENNLNFLSASNYRLSAEVAQLKERVDKQEHTINTLLDILGRVFRSGASNLSYDMPQYTVRKEPSANYFLENDISDKSSDSVAKVLGLTTNIERKNYNSKDKGNSDKKGHADDMHDIFF